MAAFIVAGIWLCLILFVAVKVQQAMKPKAITPLANEFQAKPLTREEKAEAAKDKLEKDKVIIQEAEISDATAKKMAERHADKTFNRRLKKIIDE